MYEALATFDDRAALAMLTLPRLAFAGDADRIEYGAAWGDTVVRIGEPLAANRARSRRPAGPSACSRGSTT